MLLQILQILLRKLYPHSEILKRLNVFYSLLTCIRVELDKCCELRPQSQIGVDTNDLVMLCGSQADFDNSDDIGKSSVCSGEIQ